MRTALALIAEWRFRASFPSTRAYLLGRGTASNKQRKCSRRSSKREDPCYDCRSQPSPPRNPMVWLERHSGSRITVSDSCRSTGSLQSVMKKWRVPEFDVLTLQELTINAFRIKLALISRVRPTTFISSDAATQPVRLRRGKAMSYCSAATPFRAARVAPG